MAEYAVYLTQYYGDKLPPYYIGSSSVKRIENGYRGSVSSVKWKKIFEDELKNNPDRFNTTILAVFDTRAKAFQCERELQIDLGVVKSTMFFNEAIAGVDGCFGRDVRGKLNPQYGAKKSEKMIQSVIAANTGNCTVFDTVEKRFCKIAVEDYHSQPIPKRYVAFEHDSRTKNLISENTSRSMKELVSKGNHWFSSDSHRKLVSSLRSGVPLKQEQKVKISKTRLEMFKQPWLLGQRDYLDFEKALMVVEWSALNYKYRCVNYTKNFETFCSEIGVDAKTKSWVSRKLRKSNREATFELFERYKEWKIENS